MDLQRLTYFAAVADAGSYSRAAAALHLSQPALSRQILLLEEELGQRLLERHGRGVRLTESGKALRGHVRSIVAVVEQARADMAERLATPRGHITVGLPPRVAHVIAPDLVQRFLASYPEASITVEESLSIRLREWLVASRLDVAVLFDPPPTPQLHTDTLLREPLVLIATTALPPRMRLAAVADHALVLPSGPQALRQVLEHAVQRRGIPLRIAAEVDSMSTVLALVARGVGATVVPTSVLRTWQHPQPLYSAQITHPGLRNHMVLAVPSARPSNRLTRLVTELLRELVQQHFGPQVLLKQERLMQTTP